MIIGQAGYETTSRTQSSRRDALAPPAGQVPTAIVLFLYGAVECPGRPLANLIKGLTSL